MCCSSCVYIDMARLEFRSSPSKTSGFAYGKENQDHSALTFDYDQTAESFLKERNNLMDRSDSAANPFEPKTAASTAFSLETRKADKEIEDSRRAELRKKNCVPMWRLPSKVLLVEDDAVCRSIGSKLLQVFGCSYDIASDGMDAIKKMNLQRYDIVLMVISKLPSHNH